MPSEQGHQTRHVRFPCSNCGKALSMPASKGGMYSKCPHCWARVRVPIPDLEAPGVVPAEKKGTEFLLLTAILAILVLGGAVVVMELLPPRPKAELLVAATGERLAIVPDKTAPPADSPQDTEAASQAEPSEAGADTLTPAEKGEQDTETPVEPRPKELEMSPGEILGETASRPTVGQNSGAAGSGFFFHGVGFGRSGGSGWCDGFVANRSGHDYTTATFMLTVYSHSGRLLGRAHILVFNVEHGADRMFRASLPSNVGTVGSYSIEFISGG